jgi:hypothetical protein
MKIQLAFVFTLPIHLCHLFQRLEHCLNDFLVGIVNVCTYIEVICTNQLVLHKADVNREVLDKMNESLAFLARQFCLLDISDLFILTRA